MALQNLKTVWGENITDKPLQEYPRPQFVRDSYLNLNGKWDCAFRKASESYPETYDGTILVPFSPESSLSGVGRQLMPDEILYYRTFFTFAKSFNKGRVLLHFGAVDCIAEVRVNGLTAGVHTGGYNPFTFDITQYLREKDNELTVAVRDYTDSSFHTNGKQSSRRHGMWYTPQSGIWQTVWIESVPSEYVAGIKITPDFDKAQVTVEIYKNFDDPVTVAVTDDGKEVAKADGRGKFITVRFPDGKFTPWTPDNPFLYGMKIISRYDYAESYFGMRKFGMEKTDGFYRLTLNNRPYFHNGLLDQGYWSDGLYTAPSDEAMIYDISTMKELGFNMLRKHIKVEPLRWYYHCDRLGMLVWQDMPSGGTAQHKFTTLYLPFIGVNKLKDDKYARFSRKSRESRQTFEKEYGEMLDALYNCVSIAVWVPFNEAWGQFDALRIAEYTKKKDGTRLVDHASGWHDQGGGDFCSMHVYFKKVRLKKDKKRAVVLSEFGGYSYKDPRHSFNPDYTYSYKEFPDRQSFNDALETLYRRDVISQIPKGLAAAVYTEVSDVEDEVNGLLTYDRKILKADAEKIKRINSEVKL